MFVVAGASGRTGSAVVRALRARGERVREVVRPGRGTSGAAVEADLRDPAAFARALEGADGAWLLVPDAPAEPRFAAYQDSVSDALADAVTRARVPHVVLLSAAAAGTGPSGVGPGAGLWRAEQKLARVTSATLLRAAGFMEQLADSFGMLADGVVGSFLPADLAAEMVSTEDVGRFGAELLCAPRPGVVEIGGPRVSMREVAAEVGVIVGRPVRLAVHPTEAIVPAFTSFGASEDFALHVRALFEGIARGGVALRDPGRVVGTTPLEAVLRRLLARDEVRA